MERYKFTPNHSSRHTSAQAMPRENPTQPPTFVED